MYRLDRLDNIFIQILPLLDQYYKNQKYRKYQLLVYKIKSNYILDIKAWKCYTLYTRIKLLLLL